MWQLAGEPCFCTKLPCRRGKSWGCADPVCLLDYPHRFHQLVTEPYWKKFMSASCSLAPSKLKREWNLRLLVLPRPTSLASHRISFNGALRMRKMSRVCQVFTQSMINTCTIPATNYILLILAYWRCWYCFLPWPLSILLLQLWQLILLQLVSSHHFFHSADRVQMPFCPQFSQWCWNLPGAEGLLCLSNEFDTTLYLYYVLL